MPLNLPDKLPAIDLLKEENIFVIDNSRASSQDIRPLKIQLTGYSSAENCGAEPDAHQDYYRNRFDSFAFELSSSDRGKPDEAEKSYVKKYAGGTHESFLP